MHVLVRQQGGRAVKLLDQHLLRAALFHRVEWDSWRETPANETDLQAGLRTTRLPHTCCASGVGWNGNLTTTLAQLSVLTVEMSF